MSSSVGGIIPQMTGFFSNERYFHMHIFADDKSDFAHDHHTKSTDVIETIEAKLAYEREIHENGKQTRHYHVDNGVFHARDAKMSHEIANK